MHTVGVFEAKNQLTALLNEVEQGNEVLITRHGRPVARLVPASRTFDRAAAQRAADGLRAIGDTLSLGDVTIRELIDEGRL